MLLRTVRLLPLLALALACSSLRVCASAPHIGEEEITIGNEAAADAEKEHRILDDDRLLERVRQIGERVAAVANRAEVPAGYGCSTVCQFPYTFKLIDSEEVNAFSLPGGHIYVYKGLIDLCESDHELASVIAHEIAHAAHHHMVYLVREQSRLDSRMALVMVAGLVGNVNARDMSNVMAGAQYYRVARINGYGQTAEQDADRTAVSYLTEAGYNPVGMLTFLEKMAEHPELVDWGVFETHPRAGDRVKAVREQLVQDGVAINRRAVTSWSTARVTREQTGSSICSVVTIGGRVILRTASTDAAGRLTDRLNCLLDAKLQLHEIKVVGTTVFAREEQILNVSEADAGLAGLPAAAVAQRAAATLRRVLFRDIVNDLW